MSCIESDEYKETGEVLLSMRDEDGALVTVRLTAALAKEILERLGRLPDPSP